MCDYIGEYHSSDVVVYYFNTKSGDTPYTLAGTPTISVFTPMGGTDATSMSSYGISLEINTNGLTGLNKITIVMSTAPAIFTNVGDYYITLATGTVNSISKAGMVLALYKVVEASTNSNAPSLLVGTVWTNSDGSSIEVAGFPSGRNYLNQRLHHYPSSESRKITSQSVSGSRYVFGFETNFDSVLQNDQVSILP